MIGMLKMVYEDSYLRMVYEDNYMDFYELNPLPVYNLYSESDVKDLYTKNKLEITNSIFEAIKFMLKDDILEMPVFKLNIGGRLARISVVRDRIDILLKECIVNYEETEDYENCALAIKLINDQLEENSNTFSNDTDNHVET